MNRNKNPSRQQDAPAAVSILAVSDDGYLRLSFARLRKIPLIHLISGLDENSPTIPPASAVATEIIGYTEWVSKTSPAVTLGWDWQMDARRGQILLRKISKPRSNILLTDAAGADLGPARTAIQLDVLVDALGWPGEVQKHLETRYGN